MEAMIGLILVSALLILLAIGGCNGVSGDLYPAEVREYQGEDLSSIGDFRENSIRARNSYMSPITSSSLRGWWRALRATATTKSWTPLTATRRWLRSTAWRAGM
jgi:hypothetical protein